MVNISFYVDPHGKGRHDSSMNSFIFWRLLSVKLCCYMRKYSMSILGLFGSIFASFSLQHILTPWNKSLFWFPNLRNYVFINMK